MKTIAETHEGLEGRVLNVSKDGLGFVEDLETSRRYPFTFDKIEGYKGENLGELEVMGIAPGAYVRFIPTYDRILVTKIYPLADAKCPNCKENVAVPLIPDTWTVDCPRCGYSGYKKYWIGNPK
jgi:DNA-directed RNA polymerase subunit RPC12/RpoP